MPLSQPYLGICRPFTDNDWRHYPDSDYMLDARYSPDRSHLIHAYKLIASDLVRVFDFVEPGAGNLATFSHELYQLLLRACTEVETNATAILQRNGYTSPRHNWNIQDYWQLERACRLSQYQVRLSAWRGVGGVFTPFANWATTHSLPWYSAYNNVKHDRAREFERANLENVLLAITGLLVILFAQFHDNAFGRYRPPVIVTNNDDGWLFAEDSIFEVLVPSSWTDADKYDFDWSTLVQTASPFQPFVI